MQNIFKSRKLTKDKFTLISSKVVPSSSTCDDSSLSELCCSPPPYKNILLINCLILFTIFHKSLFWAKCSSSCYLSWFPQHQVTKMVLPPPPLDGMPVHHKVTPQHFIRPPWQFTSTHLYSWMERGTVSVLPKNLTQWPGQVPHSQRSEWLSG